MKSRLVLMAAFGLALLTGTSAWAQATRTWVSGVGDDANPCSRTAPCKTFPGAISKTAAGGEIDVLDPGGFGTVTVTKSITIASEGAGEGGIAATSTFGVTVNCGSDPNCVVILRGLQIDGAPPTAPGQIGVRFLAGRTLIIENSAIRNFASSSNGYGVSFQPTGTTQPSTLVIENTTISGNGNGVSGTPGTSGTGGGVFIQPGTGAAANVVIHNSRIVENNFGVRADSTVGTPGAVNVAISDSVVSNSVNGGVAAVTNTTPVVVTLHHSTVGDNFVGLNSNGSGAILRFGTSAVTGNATAFKAANGGVLTTFGNNEVSDNAAVGTTPTSSPVS